MKRATVAVFSALLLGAVASGTLAVGASDAQAAGGGSVNKCGGGSILLNADEKRSFTRHNSARAQRNLKPLCVHPALQKAARAHSKDMINKDYFSHDTKGRREDACERVRRYGYRWRTCGENIGYNSTPDAMFNAWMKSSGHRRNIMNGGFREVGIGTHTGRFQGYTTTMYTVDFGNRR